MMPSTMSHDLMRATEAETVRAARYAHHRADSYRRPGPFLAALLQAWLDRIPFPRRVKPASTHPAPVAREPLRLTVSGLDNIGIGADSDAPFPPGRIAWLATRRLDRKEQHETIR
jgi:hypothetical protein